MSLEIEASTMKKICRNVIPLLALLYFAAFIDRVNVSFAALQMNRDLGFSSYVYGMGAGIFFIGYVLFEVPSNLILHKIGARRWIAQIMFIWAILAGAMVFVKDARGFYILRFLLGVAEAGFFPGVVYYLTDWAPTNQRARLVGLFMTAIPISTAVGGPLSSLILSLDGLFNLAGWQWLFLLETIPSFILSFITYKYLLNKPIDAKWLTNEEKQWLTQTLATEKSYRQTKYPLSVMKTLINPHVLMLSVAYFGVELSLYGVILWIPQLFKSMGIATSLIGYVVVIPYALAAIAMVAWSRHSDRFQERVWHIGAASLIGFFGLICSTCFPHSSILTVVTLTLGAIGTLSILPIFWTLPTTFLSGSAAAGGIALINALGHIGGFAGPFVIGWVKESTGSFSYGLLVLSSGVLLTGIITFALRTGYQTERYIEHENLKEKSYGF